MRIRAALERLRGENGGFTIVELLLAALLGLIVLGAVVNSYVAQLRSEDRSVSRANSADEVIPGIERMTRDIRSAVYAQVIGGSAVNLVVPVRNSSTQTRRVYYACTGGTSAAPGSCTRDQSAGEASSAASQTASLSGHPVTIVSRVRDAAAFTPTSVTYTGGTVTTTPYIGIQLNVFVGGGPTGRVVQYTDGVTLRNVPTS